MIKIIFSKIPHPAIMKRQFKELIEINLQKIKWLSF